MQYNIEFARNVLQLPEAHSTEIKEYTPEPVIDLMGEQKSITNMGGTMRLGEYPCSLSEGSKAAVAYNGKSEISSATATGTNSTTPTSTVSRTRG